MVTPEAPAITEGEGPSLAAKLIIKNTAYLTAAQVLTIPISIGLNAFMARYLGAEAFGVIYFATTLATFGYLVVNWGHGGVIPRLVAQDREVSGDMLGSSLAWRAVVGVVVYAVLALACYFLDYDAEVQWVFLIVFLTQGLISVHAACKDTMRGFERTDIPSAIHLVQQFLTAAITIPVLIWTRDLQLVLGMAIVSHLLLLPPVFRLLRYVGTARLRVRRETLKELFVVGAPWVAFGATMEIQPNIDAFFLSKMAPAEVMGWYAVSRRLVGPLLLPATALGGAVYPTLCRLFATDMDGFVKTARGMIHNVTLIVVPIAACTALFPEIGVAIFSRDSFGAAEDNMRVFSVFLLLVYFTMPIGLVVLASGRQKGWAYVQGLCVITSLVLDPILIPRFQSSHGNGGLGLCIAASVSEALVMAGGMTLLPKGVWDVRLLRGLGLSLLSAIPMIAVALLCRSWPPLVVAPIAVTVYVVAAWLTGAVDKVQFKSLAGAVGRKLGRFLPKR